MIIGNVILYNDKKYVITDLDNREQLWHCSFNRTYSLIPLEDAIQMTETGILNRDLEIKLDVSNVTTLPFETLEDEAPFEFKEMRLYSIRRKTTKSSNNI